LLLFIWQGKKLVFPDIIPADESHPNHASPRKGPFRFPGRLRMCSLRLFGDLRSFSPCPQRTNGEKGVAEPPLVAFQRGHLPQTNPTSVTTTHSQQSTSRESPPRGCSMRGFSGSWPIFSEPWPC